MPVLSEKRVTWKAPEHDYHEKDVSWYWMSIIVAVALLGLATWQRNFLFGVFIVIAEVLIIVWGYQKPKIITFMISSDGLHIGEEKHYLWNALRAYSVNADDAARSEWVDIYFHFESHFKPSLSVKVGASDLGRICAALNGYLVEADWDPSFIDALGRWTKF